MSDRKQIMSNDKSKIATLKSLDLFSRTVFQKIGVDSKSSDAATRAMLHGSLHGVDSHGIRLLPHYAQAFEGGRLNKKSKLEITTKNSGTSVLNANNSHGAVGTYAAIDHGINSAKENGIAAVVIQNTSHFGPAGAFSKVAADNGMIGLVFGNSDSFVQLYDGVEPFHGTNPISVAVPSGEANPWLLDMATSSVPFNRVELHRSQKSKLPPGVASDKYGSATIDPFKAEMLTPLGGFNHGFKGAGLGGVAEIFSAVLSGMRLSPDILPMTGSDFTQPRGLGAFVIVIDPTGFVAAPIFQAGMLRYLSLLRNSKPRQQQRVMAPGDREWKTARKRSQEGIPLDPTTVTKFYDLALTLCINVPWK